MVEPGGQPQNVHVVDRAACPKYPGLYLLDVESMRAVSAGCHAYGCDVCGPHKAAWWPWVVVDSRPERFVTITLVPERWQHARDFMRDLRRRLRDRGYRYEHAWVLERGKKRGMHHAHGVQHGDYIPQRVLEQAAGGRRVDIRAVESRSSAALYMVKGAAAALYMVKGAAAALYMSKGGQEAYRAALRLNGGRPLHFSRKFFRAEDGRPRTAQEAMRSYKRARGGGTWITVQTCANSDLHTQLMTARSSWARRTGATSA